MRINNIVGAALAASALFFSGAARADTLSSAAMPTATPVNAASLTRAAAPAEGESELFGAPILFAVLAAAAVIASIVIAVDDGDTNDSPG